MSRRYGDFKTLSDELRKRYPEEDVRAPPAKDKTVTTSTSYSAFTPRASLSSQTGSQDSLPSIERQPTISGVRLAREKNRLTLRAYLHSLMNNAVISSSPVLRHFLLSDATRLSLEELEDAKRREEADKKREEGRIHFSREIAARVEGLRLATQSVKGDIMQKGKGKLLRAGERISLLRLIRSRRAIEYLRYRSQNGRREGPSFRIQCRSRMG